MESSVVTMKGQIVIPARLRKQVGLKQGTRVYLEERDGYIIVHPATPSFYEKTCGILKGGRLLKALKESRQSDRKREEALLEVR